VRCERLPETRPFAFPQITDHIALGASRHIPRGLRASPGGPLNHRRARTPKTTPPVLLWISRTGPTDADQIDFAVLTILRSLSGSVPGGTPIEGEDTCRGKCASCRGQGKCSCFRWLRQELDDHNSAILGR